MKIVVAVAAVAIALAVMWMSGIGSGHSGVASAAPVEVDLAPLTARVAALEKQNTELLRKLDGSKLETPAASTREPAQQSAKQTAIDDLSSHVAKLEAELTDFRAKLDAQTRAGAGSALNQGKPDPTPASLDELTRRARDVAATEAQRLAALRELRGKTLPDGTDARLPVLDDMIRLAQNSTDAEARADVWRQLNHITDARLKQPLLDALAFDTDRKAREKAADTLGDFMPDAVVEAALRQALQNDVSSEVKKAAAKSLSGH